MAGSHITLLVRGFDAFNARDIDGLIEMCDPQLEMHSAFAAVGATAYHGHEGVRAWARDMEDAWGEIQLDVGSYVERGDELLVFSTVSGRGKASGAAVTMPVAQVVRLRDGLCVYMKTYENRQQALTDMGVTEDVMIELGL